MGVVPRPKGCPVFLLQDYSILLRIMDRSQNPNVEENSETVGFFTLYRSDTGVHGS